MDSRRDVHEIVMVPEYDGLADELNGGRCCLGMEVCQFMDDRCNTVHKCNAEDLRCRLVIHQSEDEIFLEGERVQQ